MQIEVLSIEPTEDYPNNGSVSFVCYREAFLPNSVSASKIEQEFTRNNWGGMWRNGIFDFHHYHSNTHEALGVYCGWAVVQFGGPSGPVVRVEAGDVVLVPAGVAHKMIRAGSQFAVVGAYPEGRKPDLKRGGAVDGRESVRNDIDFIASLPTPPDPVESG